MTKRLLSFVLTLSVSMLMANLSPTAFAQVFKCQDDKGKVSFSDQPCKKQEVDKSQDVDLTINIVSSEDPPKDAPVDPESLKGKAVVTLQNGEKVELITKTMKSQRGLTWHLHNNLMLPNGVDVSYKKMKAIEVLPGASDKLTRIKITMLSGESSDINIESPVTYVSGETKIGKFSEKLYKIKTIRFY